MCSVNSRHSPLTQCPYSKVKSMEVWDLMPLVYGDCNGEGQVWRDVSVSLGSCEIQAALDTSSWRCQPPLYPEGVLLSHQFLKYFLYHFPTSGN